MAPNYHTFVSFPAPSSEHGELNFSGIIKIRPHGAPTNDLAGYVIASSDDCMTCTPAGCIAGPHPYDGSINMIAIRSDAQVTKAATRNVLAFGGPGPILIFAAGDDHEKVMSDYRSAHGAHGKDIEFYVFHITWAISPAIAGIAGTSIAIPVGHTSGQP
jgi:hypothetical protein